MGKTESTIQLEKAIWEATKKNGVFGCFEVTISHDGGDERVDYMTFDAKDGIWRFYEIKASRSDFHSQAKKTFFGNYNYYVMPTDLYESVKVEIPPNIGVFVGGRCVKRASKQVLVVDEQILKNSIIRSLSRENEKFINTCDVKHLDNLKRRLHKAEIGLRDSQNKNKRLNNAYHELCDKYQLDSREVRQFLRELV